MSSEWQLDNGIHSIKSAWRREHTARTNLEKMLEQAEAENAKLRGLCSELLRMAETHDPEWLHWPELHGELRELGVKVD